MPVQSRADRQHVAVVGAFLVFAMTADELRVGHAVAEQIPAALGDRLADIGIAAERRDIEHGGAGDAMLVEHLQHAPEADARAELLAAVHHHVGRHARPSIDPGVGRRVQFVEQHVRAHPHRDARVVGPHDARPLGHRQIVDPGLVVARAGAPRCGEIGAGSRTAACLSPRRCALANRERGHFPSGWLSCRCSASGPRPGRQERRSR